ncbi:hypothetical protein A9168_08315 [Macellibacteroides sp. HH-ZS]|nr:hypothetical protein A9168_08315 [Macellibacteroides sp. HH-ZS]
MSKKVRRGMHARILWPIFRAGIPEDFSNAESLTLHISRVNTALKTYVPDTHISISGNVISFIVTAEMLKPLTSGEYRATIAYRKVSATSPTLWEPYIFDQPCFTLVDSSVELGGATSGMEIDTIELNGEIGIAKEGLPGASAYRIAVANGFQGDEVEWLLSLKQPALDAAEIATQAASSANSAAGKAIDATSDLDAIKQSIADSEAIREQKEQTRQQNEVSRETTFTEKIQESEQATSAATQAANEANTAAGKTINATSDLDAIKQAIADSEAIREQKEQTRQQNEVSRGTIFTEKIQESEQATSAATQAANEANTAASKAIDATSDLDAIKQAIADSEAIREQKEQTRQQNEVSRETTFTEKIQASEQATSAATQAAGAQNTYNVTVAIPLSAGSYYTKSTARAAVPDVSRKLGLLITFATSDKIWYSEKYIGTTVSGWTTKSNWEQIPDAAKMTQFETDIAYMYPSVPTSKRVLADAGTIKSRSTLNELTNKFLDLLPNTKLLFCPHLAVKLRESGIYKYVTKLYDVGPGMLDGSQTTALNQPYLFGNIAPNEKYALKNPNGGNSYMTHTPISFSETDKWSITTCLCDYDFDGARGYYVSSSTGPSISLKAEKLNHNFTVYIGGSIQILPYNTRKLFGKNNIITITYLANALKLYINGAFCGEISVIAPAYFDKLFHNNPLYQLSGTIPYHAIRDIALTQRQIQDEYNYLRSLFPEIESVQIGTQTWATSNCEMACTPQGNAIQEMQSAANVEKITNIDDREFTSDTGFWTKLYDATISDGIMSVANNPVAGSCGISKIGILTVGKWYKISFNIKTLSSDSITVYAGTGSSTARSTIGENTVYSLAAGDGRFRLYSGPVGQYFEIENISIQEVGWSDSTNLYNYVYANTTGTVEQKEYAAVKASAMWCHYNNDPALGAIYGKLYNWYAVKLLQMDIDYYNSTNPTATWGWRVPTSANFNALSTYLGGLSLAGGRLKKDGIDYWSTPNTGSDNTIGFSSLGSGYRDVTGPFSGLKSFNGFFNADSSILRVDYNTVVAQLYAADKASGRSLRLIKS